MREHSPKSFHAEVRDTVIKSGLTGVAATVLAVTVFSPAGLGGMVGTSLASGFGFDPGMNSTSDNVYANLPAYPSPLTPEELSDIRSKLARTTASLEITRAATEAKIQHIRAISLTEGAVSFAPAPRQAAPMTQLRSLTEPHSVQGFAPIDEDAAASGVSAVVGVDRDPNLELADLMFAHENL